VEELYDTESDPFEIHNLVDDARYTEQLEELREAHQAWERDTHDVGFTPEKDVFLSMWPNGVQPVTQNVTMTFEKKTGMVTLASTQGASIVYRADPAAKGWLLYTRPFKVKPGTEVRATAIRYGFRQSAESVLITP
jgi:hypothetical protein